MGLIYAFAAFLSWGLVVPVHFRLLDGVAPGAILAHRIVWSALFVAGLLALSRRRWANPFPLRARDGLLALSALAIAVNWLLYLVAVGSGRMLEASLGYFINPLVSVALGRVVLGERLRPAQAAAVAIAAVGVVLAVAVAGRLPALSLGLAVSFAAYGLLRKLAGADAMTGFFVETLLLCPVALGYLALAPDAMPTEAGQGLLLVLTGVTTALPLIWFAAAARRLRLATLGLLQYVAPTCLLGLGTLVYGEHLAPDRAVLFALIWAALALYAGEALLHARRATAAGKEGR